MSKILRATSGFFLLAATFLAAADVKGDATARKQFVVQATTSQSDAVLKVYVTSTVTLIGTLTKKNGKYTGKFTWPTNPQNITVKSSGGGSASKAVMVR